MTEYSAFHQVEYTKREILGYAWKLAILFAVQWTIAYYAAKFTWN